MSTSGLDRERAAGHRHAGVLHPGRAGAPPYFYGHSLVAHSPLEFTAQQRKMVLGLCCWPSFPSPTKLPPKLGKDLAVGLMLLAGRAGPTCGGPAPCVFGWGHALEGAAAAVFSQLERGVLASWPVFALALVWFGVFFGVQMLVARTGPGPRRPGRQRRPQRFANTRDSTAPWAPCWCWAAAVLLCFIRLEYNYKSLLVLRARLGNRARTR